MTIQWKPCVPESACFLNVAVANVAANLPATHPTSMFCLLKAVSVEERIFLARTPHLFTCIYSQVFNYLRHSFV